MPIKKGETEEREWHRRRVRWAAQDLALLLGGLPPREWARWIEYLLEIMANQAADPTDYWAAMADVAADLGAAVERARW